MTPRFRYPDKQTMLSQRRFTASAKVTGRETIICGGVRLSDGRTAPYSASYDPDAPQQRADGTDQIMAATISESSPALPGLRAAANISGRGGSLSGTSAAAPLLARKLAQLLKPLRCRHEGGETPDARKALMDLLKPGDNMALPDPLAPGATRTRPGHVSLDEWIGVPPGGRKTLGWTGEPAEYSQSRIGQGVHVPKGAELRRIWRR